jgi:hypothetical protein
MPAEVAAAIRLRDRHYLTWREIGRILRRDHSTIRKAVSRVESGGSLIPNIPATMAFSDAASGSIK